MRNIPEVPDPERYLARDFIDSKFIEIKSNEFFKVEMQYPLLNMDNAERQCLIREEVYERLVDAALKLPKGFRFKILDGWRPFALQHELYEKYALRIVRELNLEKCSEEQKSLVIRKFVSEPIPDKYIPPVHTTGGAIDLTIVDKDGCELDMGSGFDEFTDRTYTSYYENEKNILIRDNRRMLYYAMTDAGFTNLPSEWWHFDYGDRFWGYYCKRPAMYSGVFTKEEMDG